MAKKVKQNSPKLSLVQALSWIVGSTFVISASGHSAFQKYFRSQHTKVDKSLYLLTSLIQTGPQKEALRSEYLAQLMHLSMDRPRTSLSFDTKEAEKALLASPLIQEAHVKVLKPSTVYVDYTVRQPVAWLYDYENVALDKEGHLFPVHPFFSPKNLPEVYLGLAPFGQKAPSTHLSAAEWKQPLKGDLVDLSFDVLSRLQPLARDLFTLKRIDVSHAFAETYGSREIVVVIENEVPSKEGNRQVLLLFPHYLRLSAKNYPQELGNYLELRKKLLEEDYKLLKVEDPNASVVRAPQKVIDLRLSQLAFIEEVK